MYLEEFFNYKNQMMKDILTDPTIVDLISPGMSVQEAPSLAYTQIMPCEFYDFTIEEGKVYVCFDVDIHDTLNKNYYSLYLYVWVFVHKSLLRLPEGGLRSDALCSKINEKINGSLYYGLGRLSLSNVGRFAPLQDFTGKVMRYSTEDFNMSIADKRNVPSNRKSGQ